jgi:hypothetical protein
VYPKQRWITSLIAELGHGDRICQIDLDCYPTPQIEKLWTAMQVPFPELAYLYLSLRGWSYGGLPHGLVLPDSFLGGSAPRLRFLTLTCIPFPGLPKVLLSATHLVHLYLHDIPHSGYISPEAMATCLSVLTSLETLQLEFESPQSSPDQETRRPPPPTRSVLPSLTKFLFKGVNEYLEEVVARIDTPRLYRLWAKFFTDIDFYTPELIRFITRTFEAPKDAHVVFDSRTAWVTLQRQAFLFADVRVEISCRVPGWQLSSLAQICISSLLLLSTTENLYIHEHLKSKLDWKRGIENTEWLELLVTHLVNLWLVDIPHSGYISPEAMATCLSMLTSLEELQLNFESPQSCPDQEKRRSPPPTRSILPALTSFWFKGVNEYLEDLVSWIDSPRLSLLSTTFFNDIDFNTPEPNQFISRTPTLGSCDEARLIFHSREALVRLCSIPA